MSRRVRVLLGLGLIAASSVGWLLGERHYRKTSYFPVEKAFDGKRDSELREEFKVNLSQSYSVRLVLDKTHAVSETLQCNIHAKILRDGDVVWDKTLDRIDLAASSNEDLRYGLGWVDLSSGTYELVVTNQSDLSYLEPLNPRMNVKVTPAALEWDIWEEGALTLLCVGTLLAGLILMSFGSSPRAAA
jgi:hypothetical protein